MKTPIEAACYLAKSHLASLVNVLGSDDLDRDKLMARHTLDGAARFASLLEQHEAARILYDAADGLLSPAMYGPNTAGHLAYLFARVERSEGQSIPPSHANPPLQA